MASPIDVERLSSMLGAYEAELRPRIGGLLLKAESVDRSSRLVGQAWSGSCMGHHGLLYFQNFESPDFGHRFNVEWGTLHGLPPGWRAITVDEVKGKIRELSSVDLDDLERDYGLFVDDQNRFRDDLLIELIPIELSDGLAKEKLLLSSIESLAFDKKEESEYIANAINSMPRITRDVPAITAGRMLPVHTYYEAIAHKIQQGCNKAEELLNKTKLLLRRVEASTKATEPKEASSISELPQFTPVEVFVSYAHADEDLRSRLAKHLKPLEREGTIKQWYDRQISPGEEFTAEIDDALNRAGLILLLVSPDFVSSDYCWSKEMKRALERHEAREAIVVPIILRPIDWHNTPFAKLLALPRDGKPVTNWTNPDDGLLDVAKGVRMALSKHQHRT